MAAREINFFLKEAMDLAKRTEKMQFVVKVNWQLIKGKEKPKDNGNATWKPTPATQ